MRKEIYSDINEILEINAKLHLRLVSDQVSNKIT